MLPSQRRLERWRRRAILRCGIELTTVGVIACLIYMMKEILQRVDLTKTYHTGYDPYQAVGICVLMVLFGVVHAALASRRRWLPIVLVVLSVFSGVLIMWLIRHNIVVQYDEWIKSSLPDHPI